MPAISASDLKQYPLMPSLGRLLAAEGLIDPVAGGNTGFFALGGRIAGLQHPEGPGKSQQTYQSVSIFRFHSCFRPLIDGPALSFAGAAMTVPASHNPGSGSDLSDVARE